MNDAEGPKRSIPYRLGQWTVRAGLEVCKVFVWAIGLMLGVVIAVHLLPHK